ncbi:MAG: MBL fold metallo-hydrolase [Desulfatiglandales bacterium]|jgi:L-ascorbate metabolism protein UlaG (beta-lactamase superfamily)|nr:MBL fold metallo-hydrolase [Desulfatiglandales bacterium]
MYSTDTIKTAMGELKITFIGHGTLMLHFDNLVIHVDPVSDMGDYSRLPKADLIMITHGHPDHLDLETIERLRKEGTDVVLTETCAKEINTGIVMKNGDSKTIKGLKVEAVPAYNIVHMHSPGNPFHPKGDGNGYVITFSDKKVYVAGDTENISELKQLSGIDVAFLPMNLPYTMTPEMAAEAALAFNPKIFYPYHFGSTDTSDLVERLKDHQDIEVRIRDLQ